MKLDKESAVVRAKHDLSERLGIKPDDIATKSVGDQEFRDMSLGAASEGEMAAQMISYGWRILLEAGGKSFEYRGDKYQLRLYDYKGKNHVIV